MTEKILEVCKVTPPQDSPTHFCLPLTLFDLLCFNNLPTDMLFFYESPQSNPLLFSSIIPKLKQSLALTLRHFLPVSGKLTWQSASPHLVIRYNEGDAVTLTIAQSDADFNNLCSKNIRDCNIFSPLIAQIVESGSQVPVVAFKVTLFPTRGFCIGITTNHAVFDAKSVALFLKSWASISKFGETKGLGPELTPVFNRTHIREQFKVLESSFIEFLKRGLSGSTIATSEFKHLSDQVRCTFKLSGLNVRKLKELVYASLAKDDLPYISTFRVTHAFAIVCLVKAIGLKNRWVHIFIPIDYRRWIKPPVSGNYFGNCIAPCSVDLSTEEVLGKDGMAIIVASIGKGLKILDDESFSKGVENVIQNGYNQVSDPQTNIYVAGSSRLGAQSIDFGWGLPSKVELHPMDKFGAVSYTEVDGGGLEIDLTLKKHEMERFNLAFAEGLGKLSKDISATL